MEEDFRPQEALVAHINSELLLADGVDTGVLFDPLGTVRVVFVELFNKIWAHVAEAFLRKQDKYNYINHEIIKRGRRKVIV